MAELITELILGLLVLSGGVIGFSLTPRYARYMEGITPKSGLGRLFFLPLSPLFNHGGGYKYFLYLSRFVAVGFSILGALMITGALGTIYVQR